MAIYKYKCTCGVVTELVQPMIKDLPKTQPCLKCGKDAEFLLQGAPAVATSGMSNAPLDVVVGRDAHARWADINRRQELRDKVRRESNQVGLSFVGRNEFAPLPETEKQKRTEALDLLKQQPIPSSLNPNDKHLIDR